MDIVLGLLGIVVWVVSVIALAMAVTWIVVKISPTGEPKRPKQEGAAES
ncbi:MAG TPA: hypothetical protein VHK22_03765 [Gaiellaceae bacterium]|jgi:hypothetical protein|nr:hypothetical protein [Gaiellaceae bacterium]